MTKGYDRYAERCRTEGLEPFSFAAWKLMSEPMTFRSMCNAYYSTLWLDRWHCHNRAA